MLCLNHVSQAGCVHAADGKTTTHALGLLEPRGVLFTSIQQEVYSGMIIGECSRDGEMEVSRYCTWCTQSVSQLILVWS